MTYDCELDYQTYSDVRALIANHLHPDGIQDPLAFSRATGLLYRMELGGYKIVKKEHQSMLRDSNAI